MKKAFQTLITALVLAILAGRGDAATAFHTNATFTVSFALPAKVQATLSLPLFPIFSLNPLWAIGPTNDPAALITPSDGNQRTIAYDSSLNQLYVVSRSSSTTSNYVIYVLNAGTGAVVTTLDTSALYNGGAVGEGGVGLASIAVADDGAIYACNLTPDACGCGPAAGVSNSPADSLFRIYRWANGSSNSTPAMEVFSGDPAGQTNADQWGETLAVRGSGATTEILLDNRQGNFAALLKPTDGSMTNFTNSALALVGKPLGTNGGRSLQFGTGNTNTMWQKRYGLPLRLSTYDTNNHTFSKLKDFGGFAKTIGPVAIDSDRSLLAGIDFKGTTNSPDLLALYALVNPSSSSRLVQSKFPTNHLANPDFAGQVVIGGGGIWALDANNGLMAFGIRGPNERRIDTAVPGRIGNSEIIQALGIALRPTNVSGAKLMYKRTDLGQSPFFNGFILRKGTNDIGLTSFFSYSQPAAVSAETTNPAGTLTNIIDYTTTGFTLDNTIIRFDVQGFGLVKSASIVDHGQIILGDPFPTSITASVDGVAIVQGVPMIVHGLASLNNRKIEILTNQPPVASISSPTNTQVFAAGTDLVIKANASDSDGDIAKVEFFENDQLLGERTFVFYNFTRTNLPAGNLTYTVRATDSSGDTTTSAPISITVTGP